LGILWGEVRSLSPVHNGVENPVWGKCGKVRSRATFRDVFSPFGVENGVLRKKLSTNVVENFPFQALELVIRFR
jgi:hypothetical protein